MKRNLIACFTACLICLIINSTVLGEFARDRGPVRERRDPGRLSRFMHEANNIRTTVSNWGEFGNPEQMHGYWGFEFPKESESDFLFSAGFWVGAIVNDEMLVSTTTDGDDGTNDYYATIDYFVYQSNLFDEDPFHFSLIGLDDDGDWNPETDDLDEDGEPSSNWDGGAGFIGYDDDHDGETDEEEADGMDDDDDGLIDEDTRDGDDNGDGNCWYDPEPHVDEDPPGNIAADMLDNDHDGLVDGDDDDLDGDADPDSDDDDGDGEVDEDGAANSAEDILAVYDDLDPDASRNPDPDGHTPLGIMIEQRTYSYNIDDHPVSDVLIVEATIRNVGEEDLQDVYFGLFADADVAARGESGDAASVDDWNFYDAGNLMAIHGDDTTDQDELDPGVFAMKILRTPDELENLSIVFKNFERISGGDPDLNSDKYRMISDSPENNSPPTGELGDWRFLIGFGPSEGSWTLEPGETFNVAFAMIGGTTVPAVRVTAVTVQEFYDRGRIAYWQGDYVPHPARPRLSDVGDGESLRVTWSRYAQIPQVSGIRLYYGDLDEMEESIDFEDDNQIVLDGLAEGTSYYFAIAILDNEGEEGSVSDSTWMTPLSVPRKPTQLWIYEMGYHRISLGWAANEELDIAGYNLYRSADEGEFRLLNEQLVEETVYTDYMDEFAVYSYRLTALDNDGNESEAYGADPEDAQVTGAPFILEEGAILVVDETKNGNGNPGSPDDEQADEFYRQALSNFEYDEFDYTEFVDRGGYSLSTLEIGRYEIIVWHADDRSQLFLNRNNDILNRFLGYNGKLLLSGWNLLANYTNDDSIVFTEGDFPGASLGIAGGRCSTVREFIGATGRDGYPDLRLAPGKIPEAWEGLNYTWQIEPVRGQVIYSFVSSNEESSFNGVPCAMKMYRMDGSVVVLGFPLYFMEPEGAGEFMNRALNELIYDVEGSAGNLQPLEFSLEANYPNPFNSTTVISFTLPISGQVRLVLYDLQGREIRTLTESYYDPGSHRVNVDLVDLPSGVYVYSLQMERWKSARKMVLLR